MDFPDDILYDFDEDQYQFTDPFQSWLLYGHAEHEKNKPSLYSFRVSPITPPRTTTHSSDDEDSFLDDCPNNHLPDTEEILMSGTPTNEPHFQAQGQKSEGMSSVEGSPFTNSIGSSIPSIFRFELDETPLYTTADTNIFIRALQIPIPNDESIEPEDQEPWPLYRSLASPDNYMESPSDEHLPRYFIKKYGTDTGTMGFPNIYGVMYAQSWTNPVLRHACLAVASFWAGRRAGHTFTHRSAAHINFLLPELQRVIRSRSFDDGHLCAVYMLMSFALDTNRYAVMQKHGEGLVLMLRHLGYLQPTSNGRHVLSDRAPPLVIHIWRLALRDDNMCGFSGPGLYKLCLPAMEMIEQPYERCMSSFMDQDRLHLRDIKRELFRKDLLTHRILHFQNQVISLRATGAYRRIADTFEQHIARQGKVVMDEIGLQRQKISHHYLRTTSSTSKPVKPFLHHLPLYTTIWDSYCLFIYNSQTYIHATLIIDPKLGRSEKYPQRTTAAIDLCRAVAGREKHLSPQAASLCFAGLSFIGTNPRELAWVEHQLDKLVRSGRPSPGLYLDVLLHLKEHPEVSWQAAWLEVMSSAATPGV